MKNFVRVILLFLLMPCWLLGILLIPLQIAWQSSRYFYKEIDKLYSDEKEK
jgi:hypothetical protein